jgi:hypothetical protein
MLPWSSTSICNIPLSINVSFTLSLPSIFNFPEEENDWDLRYSQRYSFSIIRLFVALLEFPYLGYRAASSQGTKLNPLWKGALYVYIYIYFFYFLFALFLCNKKTCERGKSIFIEMESNLPILYPETCYEDRTQSATVKKLKVRTINSHFTKSGIFWNSSFVIKPSVPEIPHFVINVVSEKIDRKQ